MDPEDPTVIAENELLGAAAAIEAAAKKLEQLKPRAKPKVGPSPAPLLVAHLGVGRSLCCCLTPWQAREGCGWQREPHASEERVPDCLSFPSLFLPHGPV